MHVPDQKPILIIGAGVSGLLLAQHLRKTGLPFRIFERDADLNTRGLGWGLTLHWSLPALRSLLPEELVERLPEAYVDRAAVEQGRPSTFPFYDLSTGELKAKTPNASESQRIRVTRDRLRQLLATDLDIQVCDTPNFESGWTGVSLTLAHGVFVCRSGTRQSTMYKPPKMGR
jgi:2-polyprenyl-6-methoxyphenol hydroxylase-like FAD-dependent oxidoreductase